ncbi:sensor domain-containing protein [Nocardioides dongkuii]|uniref:sensor domain-containing protein n=1 Tax=Nocardioides dongkuii TaxID=2760089 RepID=UPI0015FE2156|nr:sensor domain-containing protein [Nocardioides dongkuii]
MTAASTRLVHDTAYVLSALVLAVVSFVVAVVGVSVGTALLLTPVGVLVLAGTAYVARGLAQLERVRMARLLGADVPPASYAAARPGAGWLRRTATPLGDPQTWLDLLWSVLALVTGTAAFAVTVTWWAVAGGGLTYWCWQRWVPQEGDDETLAALLGLGEGQQAESLLLLAIGLAAAVTLPFVVRGCAAVHAGLAAALLCTRGALTRPPRSGPRSARAGRPSAASG